MGAHTTELLHGLGYSGTEIDGLRQTGAVA
jgi:crotonobetainyl-CoA:carnitine CoA-transferase CaiB-like acyl-CoA transferase